MYLFIWLHFLVITVVALGSFMGFPGNSTGYRFSPESVYSAGDLGLIPGLGISPREGNG